MKKKEYIQKLKEGEVSLLKFTIGKLLKTITSNQVFFNTQGNSFDFGEIISLSFLNEEKVFNFSNECEETELFEDIYLPFFNLTNVDLIKQNVYLSVTPTFFTIKSIEIFGLEFEEFKDDLREIISTENVFVFHSFDNRRLLIHFDGSFNSRIIVSISQKYIENYFKERELKLKKVIAK